MYTVILKRVKIITMQDSHKNMLHPNILKQWNPFRVKSSDKSYMSTLCIYRVSQEECARLREGVPYVKVYRYNPKHLCPKLNGYGDNGQRIVWSSGGSTHCTCQLTSLIDVYPWVWFPNTECHLTLAYSRLIPECTISHVTSVLAFMCHV